MRLIYRKKIVQCASFQQLIELAYLITSLREVPVVGGFLAEIMVSE